MSSVLRRRGPRGGCRTPLSQAIGTASFELATPCSQRTLVRPWCVLDSRDSAPVRAASLSPPAQDPVTTIREPR